MRKPIIAGNWKMHKKVGEARSLAEYLSDSLLGDKVEVVLCPPFTSLQAVGEKLQGSQVKLGAQNMSWASKGAFTGEISPLMLLDLGCEYVILGHSERRQFFGETDGMVNQKTLAAFAYGLKPIVCVGETLQTREAGQTESWIRAQVACSLAGLPVENLGDLVVAYEPIWAIGTGKSATSDEANEVVSLIRTVLGQMYGPAIAQRIRIQYGGSVKPETIGDLMSKSDIDGALVGGASLEGITFAKIVNDGV